MKLVAFITIIIFQTNLKILKGNNNKLIILTFKVYLIDFEFLLFF